jgi:hypothetical protein
MKTPLGQSNHSFLLALLQTGPASTIIIVESEEKKKSHTKPRNSCQNGTIAPRRSSSDFPRSHRTTALRPFAPQP